MYLLHSFILVIAAITCVCADKNASVIFSNLNETYNGNVGGGREDIYFFNLTNKLTSHGTVRIRSCSSQATIKSPMFFVVRKLDGVVSWSVPYTTGENKYQYYTQTICRTITTSYNGVKDNFYLDISTLNPEELDYTIQAIAESDYKLDLGIEKTVTATPAQLSFFSYTFQQEDERVLVKAVSKNKICSVLVVQELKDCASVSANTFTGPYATMTTQAGIVVEKKSMDKIFIMFMVKDSDEDCEQRKGTINPFTPHEFEEEKQQRELDTTVQDVIRCQFGDNGRRNKSITISVTRIPRIEDYTKPIIIPLVAYGLFYFITVFALAVQWCLSDTGGRSFYTYMFPKKFKKEGVSINGDGEDDDDDDDDDDDFDGGNEGDRELNETDRLIRSNNRQTLIQNSYSSVGPQSVIPTDRPDIGRSVSTTDRRDYDFLDDIDQDKDVYRLHLHIRVADTSKKSYKKMEKKFNIYYWNLMTVAVFYALPVVQLVLTYQRVTNESGDQDICYYNFFCQRPYHILSAFNNVYSNVGYVLLGILFIFLVMRRDRLSYQNHVNNFENARRYGLPKHYGIFYAMGWALVMEGIMSGCYHVCPNYSNFQFDTAFMYILGILCSLRLYQARHHDIFINGHFAFAGFAVVIFTAVIGVIYRSTTFWITFCFVHISACFVISVQLYYMGRARTALLLAWYSRGFNIFSKPLFPVRLVMLVIFNIVNWSLSIYGATVIPRDFATYLLGIIICNGLLYVGFYGVMKVINREKVKVLTVFFAFASMVTWAAALKFFVAGLTDWQTSAAQSREGNKDCIIAEFYDDHDLWHFLSAAALFFSFMCVLTIDDDLDTKERNTIAVF